MNAAVKILLSLTLSGSILAVIIFALKPFIRQRLSKSIQYYIWVVVLLRLAVPFSFETSIMNELFYGNEVQTQISSSQSEARKVSETKQNIVSSQSVINDQGSLTNAYVEKENIFQKLFNSYALYIWIIVTIIVLSINLIGYNRFLKYLKQGNKSATISDNKILTRLLKGRNNVILKRNGFCTTPMLIGIIRPCIIIPDIEINETQLKNILRHEIVHLKRFDIGVKWLTMIVTSCHWFNPLMYFIKKDINSCCELSCDEAVISTLSPSEKQDYGDTLISIVAQNKFLTRMLGATMLDEKKGLKERLLAIMNHTKKSRLIMIFSAVLLVGIIFGGLYLGVGISAGTGQGKDTPHNLYMNASTLDEISKYKTSYIGDNSKVSGIVNNIPVPDSYFRQRYISITTDKQPYKLNVFYEQKKGSPNTSDWPIVGESNTTYSNMSKNALVIFCAIDNLDEVTFAFRDSSSEGKLEEAQYDTTYNFKRSSFEDKYGDLASLFGKKDILVELLEK